MHLVKLGTLIINHVVATTNVAPPKLSLLVLDGIMFLTVT